ncbi:MAG: hypothetical protein K2G49_05420 [Muribaculum sp.]|nr:hypothetical protein [Muribaculum sp.]
MARYIKANPKVAQFLNLQNDRNTVKDGNYILWQSDLLAFGPLTHLSETLAAIGAIALMPHEAREEQDGTQLRPLPTATDPRFEIPTPPPVTTPEPEIPAESIEGNASGENPDEATAEPQVKTTAKRTAKKTTV